MIQIPYSSRVKTDILTSFPQLHAHTHLMARENIFLPLKTTISPPCTAGNQYSEESADPFNVLDAVRPRRVPIKRVLMPGLGIDLSLTLRTFYELLVGLFARLPDLAMITEHGQDKRKGLSVNTVTMRDEELEYGIFYNIRHNGSKYLFRRII